MPIFRKDGRSVLFIHVPKAGGSSIEAAFASAGYETFYLDGRVGPDTVNRLRRCTPQHMHGAMLRQNFRLHRFDAIFMIVRDPIARFRSEYLWRNRDLELDLSEGAVERWADEALRSFEADSYVYDNHVRPQADFEVDGAQVYRFEDGLPSAIADLNGKFGLGVGSEVPRVRTGHGNTGFSSGDVQISDRLRSRLLQFYRRDFERFGYGAVPTTLRSRILSSGPGETLARYYRALETARRAGG